MISIKTCEKLTTEAGNGYKFNPYGFTKFVDLENNLVLRIDIAFAERDKRAFLRITPGERQEYDANAVLLDICAGMLVFLTNPQKRKNNKLLLTFTHEYTDEKIMEMWKAHKEKKGK